MQKRVFYVEECDHFLPAVARVSYFPALTSIYLVIPMVRCLLHFSRYFALRRTLSDEGMLHLAVSRGGNARWREDVGRTVLYMMYTIDQCLH